MEKAINSLDLDNNIGVVTLTDGQELSIPKLSMSKLIKLVKFVGIDGAKLYKQFQSMIDSPDMDEMETLVAILEALEEEQLIKIIAILLDMTPKQALALDLNEMLEILVVYGEKVDFGKTFLQIRKLAKVLFKVELPPTMGEWIRQLGANMQQKGMEQEKIGTETAKLMATAGATS